MCTRYRHIHVCRCYSHALFLCVPLGCMLVLCVMYSDIRPRVTLKVNSYANSNSPDTYGDSYEIQRGRFDIAGYFYDKIKRVNSTHRYFFRLFGIGNYVDRFRSGKKKILSDSSFFDFGRTVSNVNCEALINGNNTLIEQVRKLNRKLLHGITPDDYIQMTSECVNFTLDRNYVMEPLTEEEWDFPIAFSILMYRDVEQFERLFRAIYRPQNSYCIHVDLGSQEYVFKVVDAIARCFPNVFMAPQRSKVVWGEMSVLTPELVCMKVLFGKNKRWKYFINLTGQEFPLKTNYELVQILKAYNGANDIHGTRLGANKDRWHGRGNPPHGIIPTKGPVHAIMCRGFVEYILNDQRAKYFLEWVKNTYIPDETFFASLNSNPDLKVPGSFTGVLETNTSSKPYEARYKVWRRSGGSCGGFFQRNICIFGVNDLQVLANRKELFANKFEWNYERTTFECMEELMYNRTRDEYFGKTDFDAQWYGDLEFVKNKI